MKKLLLPLIFMGITVKSLDQGVSYVDLLMTNEQLKEENRFLVERIAQLEEEVEELEETINFCSMQLGHVSRNLSILQNNTMEE